MKYFGKKGLGDLWINVTLLIVTFCICLIVAEITYRIVYKIPLSGNLIKEDSGDHRILTFQKSTNDVLVYEPIPNVKSKFEGKDTRINSWGMRDREYTVKKPQNAYRIAVLGDSLTYGTCLEYGERYTDILEEVWIDQSGRNVEVLNFGVPGYSTQQEIETYRTKAAKFDPDLVIVGYCLNDEFESSGEINLFRAYFPIYERFYSMTALRFAFCHSGFLPTFFCKRYEAKTEVSESFYELRKVVDQKIPVVIVLFPRLVNYSDYDKNDFDIHKKVSNAATKNGFYFIDLLNDFKEYPSSALKILETDYLHPNQFAHEITARVIYLFLQNNNLLSKHHGN